MKVFFLLTLIVLILFTGCTMFASSKEQIMRTASDQEKPELCQQLKTGNDRNACYLGIARKTNGTQFCDYMTPSKKIDCYVEIAKETKRPELCDTFTDITYRDPCYIDLAEKTQNITVCEKIKTYQIKENCLLGFIENSRDPKLCENPLIAGREDECILQTAKNARNMNLCNRSSGPEKRDACYLSIAKELKSEKSCDMIEAKDEREECLRWIAEKNGDLSICNNKITNVKTRYTCYSDAIPRLSSVEQCELIPKGFGLPNYQCYIKFADDLKDPSICEKIDSPEIKETCIRGATI